MRVVIREEAADDLQDVFAWIAKDDPAAAGEVIRRLRVRIGRLETPGLEHMGRLGEVTGTRELVDGPYIIVYKVSDARQEITIVAVFHARQERT